MVPVHKLLRNANRRLQVVGEMPPQVGKDNDVPGLLIAHEEALPAWGRPNEWNQQLVQAYPPARGAVRLL